ncbi:hypothetical protein LFZ31_10400 [Salmonella enterica subsp. enterica serovar Newport str. S09097]|nr:hypothetical protein LFZ31_10400 [Salmonella enterica subsp. enterica serovar Newport str. S09097]
MKKLFVQFYLLLFVCFLVMTLLVGLVYKFTAERAGRQSLDDLMKKFALSDAQRTAGNSAA